MASGLGLFPCAEAQGQAIQNGLRTDVLGCYALYAGSTRVGTSLYNASPSVRLDSAIVGNFGSAAVPLLVRAMQPLSVANEPVPPKRLLFDPSWMADSLTDTLRLSFIDGFSGTVFVLAAPRGHADTLTGRLYESWDVGPSTSNHGPARAVRQACPRRR